MASYALKYKDKYFLYSAHYGYPESLGIKLSKQFTKKNVEKWKEALKIPTTKSELGSNKDFEKTRLWILPFASQIISTLSMKGAMETLTHKILNSQAKFDHGANSSQPKIA